MFNLTVRNEDMNIEIINNGFIMQVSGRNAANDYASNKVYFHTMEDLFDGMKEFIAIPQND